MAQLGPLYGNYTIFTLKSTWSCTYYATASQLGDITYHRSYGTPSTKSLNVTFNLSSLPANYVINNVVVYTTISEGNTFGRGTITIGGQTLNRSTGYVTITNPSISGTTLTVPFTYKASNHSGTYHDSASTSASKTSNHTSPCTFENVYAVVNYTIDATACTAPTSVSISPTSCAPGATATLSWSGAGAGKNNAIAGYHIYRSTSSNGTYTHTYTVTTSSASSSCSVVAPTTPNGSYFYKVYTIGTVSGYNSGASGVASLKALVTACGAPTAVSLSKTSAGPNETVVFSWSGATAGTNNAITGYHIYRSTEENGTYEVAYTLNSNSSSGSYNVATPAGNGTVYYYRIYTIGTYADYNSGASGTAFVRSEYTAPGTPVIVCNLGESATIDANANFVLSWEAVDDGLNNPVQGYLIYDNDVQSNYTESTSITMSADSTGTHILYAVAKGLYSNGSKSNTITIIATSSPPKPKNVYCDQLITHNSTTLHWTDSGYSGEDNPFVGYEIQCRESSDNATWGSWTSLGTSTTTSFTVSPSERYGYYTQFRVRGLYEVMNGAWGYTLDTQPLRRLYAPFADYTDQNLISRETHIKAKHMNELQDNIKTLVQFYKLEEQPFSNIVAGTTSLALWTDHVEEIRSATDYLTTVHASWQTIERNSPSIAVMNRLRSALYDVEESSLVLGASKLGASYCHPTNQLIYAKDKDGTPYNEGEGYKDNICLINGVETSLEGYDTTGFIPAKVGDTICMKDITFLDLNTNSAASTYRTCVQLFDGKYNLLNTSEFFGISNLPSNDWLPVYGSNNDIIQFTIPTSFSSEACYIRIVAKNITMRSAISVNEN